MQWPHLIKDTHKPKYQPNTTKQFNNTYQSKNNSLNFSNQKKHDYQNSLKVHNP